MQLKLLLFSPCIAFVAHAHRNSNFPHFCAIALYIKTFWRSRNIGCEEKRSLSVVIWFRYTALYPIKTNLWYSTVLWPDTLFLTHVVSQTMFVALASQYTVLWHCQQIFQRQTHLSDKYVTVAICNLIQYPWQGTNLPKIKPRWKFLEFQ